MDRARELALDAGGRELGESVECLGLTFSSDEERREHFLGILREKLKDSEFRNTPGFPKGSDEDILRLSDPPYNTACPNPFLEDFVRCYGKPYDPAVPYHREPFAVDVSEGKTDALYKAHGYHTKVPHLAIVPSILHYTKPGDIVLDGFCGSGMTGVAAQWCGAAPGEYRHKLEQEWREAGLGKPEWGARRAILGDLSPAATFIAANYNLPFDVRAFEKAAKRILKEVDDEIGWMYETVHTDGKTKGRINYTVWSEVFSCPECGGEVVFLDEALDQATKRVRDTFPCPHCAAVLNKDNLERQLRTEIDPVLGTPWKRIRLDPVFINYSVGKAVYEKPLDESDRETLMRIEQLPPPTELPADAMPIDKMYHGSRLAPKGFTHIHHLFLRRQAQALAVLWRRAQSEADKRLRNALLFFVEQAIWGMSVLNRYLPTAFSQTNRQLTGVYYIASQVSEVSPWYNLGGKLTRLAKALGNSAATTGNSITATWHAGAIWSPDSSVDYVFTDPPFGENIYYADLNLLVESWHRIFSEPTPEAIVDKAKKKGLPEYQHLMQHCFEEYCRVLKPGRWMTVVFHNSKNAVWNAIQEAMLAAGFVVADVRTLDKQQGSYRQVTSTAVKQDLVISAYKPNGGLERRFEITGGTEEGVWEFVRTHLKQLPVFVTRGGEAETIAERQDYFLYDRMVAFHVQRGVTVPLSAAEFYQGLGERCAERDGMWFLPEQVAEYDKKRLSVREVLQLQIAVSDEQSAVEWMRQQLLKKPQTFQELQPQFMDKTRAGWQKHEKPLELADLLELNFLHYDGKGPIPSQILSWMRQSEKLRALIGSELGVEGSQLPSPPEPSTLNSQPEIQDPQLSTRNPELLAKARDRWYVPDPKKAEDLEKLRERALLREFEEYRESKQRRIKVFRLEAVRAGFKKAWQERDYSTIIAVAQKIPENVLQEDPKLLMWYDQAVTRSGDEG
jgi:16S rRNA G966 N2-methylase RsmD